MRYLCLVLVLFISQIISIKSNLHRVKRVIGGKPDDTWDHQYMAGLIGEKGYKWDLFGVFGDYNNMICGGTLISRNWILTAAHCFYINKEEYKNDDDQTQDDNNYDTNNNFDNDDDNWRSKRSTKTTGSLLNSFLDFKSPKYWKVRISTPTLEPTAKDHLKELIRLMGYPEKRLYHTVEKVILHPKYDPFYLHKDIALVKLKDPIDLSRSKYFDINKVPNSLKYPFVGEKCKVLGWGCKRYQGLVTNQLNSVKLPILSTNYCRKVYRVNINLTEKEQYCAGYYKRNTGICAGDSGGPVICHYNGEPVISGILSATHKNEPETYPGLITRITYFKKWILKTMKNN